jgi:hypothetical protein
VLVYNVELSILDPMMSPRWCFGFELGGALLPPIVKSMSCGAYVLNKGGLSLLFFQRQAADPVHEGFLDLDIDEFRSFSRRFPLSGAWCH